jgi:hypothetical protein
VIRKDTESDKQQNNDEKGKNRSERMQNGKERKNEVLTQSRFGDRVMSGDQLANRHEFCGIVRFKSQLLFLLVFLLFVVVVGMCGCQSDFAWTNQTTTQQL